MTLTIHVTAQTIRFGRRNAANGCPIGLAILYDTGLTANVGYDVIVFLVDGVELCLPTPVHARHFLEEFDSGRLALPFKFRMGFPDELVELMDEARVRRSNRKRLEFGAGC